MKLKYFLNKSQNDCCYIEIIKNNYRIYIGSIKDYLNNKKSINGIIKEWDIYVENWDYPVLYIIID